MKADLSNNWVALCLMPHRINKSMWDKHVACLLGDEIMEDDEFKKTYPKGGGSTGCSFCFNGACAHPFRPGSLCGMLFAYCLKGQSNARDLVNKEDEKALDERKCYGCTEGCMNGKILDSAFRGVQMFYERLFEDAKNGGYIFKNWDDFRKRGWGVYFDKEKLFPNGGEYAPYEANVKKHFLEMMKADFDKLAAVYQGKYDYSKWDEHVKRIDECVVEIKFNLVTHFINYWDKEGYKNA